MDDIFIFIAYLMGLATGWLCFFFSTKGKIANEREQIKLLRQRRELINQVVSSLEQEIREKYQENKNEYVQRIMKYPWN